MLAIIYGNAYSEIVAKKDYEEGQKLMLKTEELVVVLLIVLLLFGAKKLPELARSIGQSAKEVRKGFSEGVEDKEVKENA